MPPSEHCLSPPRHAVRFGSQPAEWVRRGEVTDLVVAADMAIRGRVIRGRACAIIFYTGIPSEAIRWLQIREARTPKAIPVAGRPAKDPEGPPRSADTEDRNHG